MRPEQRPARLPDTSGAAMREGVSLHYDTYGDGATTVLLVPAWSIVHSRIWKAQVAFLARPVAAATLRGGAPGIQAGVGSGRHPQPGRHPRMNGAAKREPAAPVGTSLGPHIVRDGEGRGRL